ncbi:MAG: sterol desaturase/sphingolipid hydroxylase (fatty acid hydroxylase superfamily) [Candidatus Azotimanducaceae bacterium]|jgi:sterol desaturase/sphingolipid hydroxylase (fatty acid hydroxylase superfamily)
MPNHSNIKLNSTLDRALIMLIVTPDMHSIHHSTRQEETSSNYGFNLTIWEKLLNTYREKVHSGLKVSNLVFLV